MTRFTSSSAFINRLLASEFVRYVLVGGTNTAITYAIYRLALFALPYAAAYTIAYIAGIPIAYFLNSRFVYHQPLHWKKAVQFPLVYVVQYAAGEALLFLWVEMLGVSDTIAPLLVIACTVPVTFVLSRVIIKGRSHGRTA